MADFQIAVAVVVHHEGGYWSGQSGTFKDPGGETYQGIARNFHPNWAGWTFIDQEKKKGTINWNQKFTALDKEVRSFYEESFWNPLLLEGVKDQAVAGSILDLAVNLGAGRAVGKIQMELNQRWGKTIKVDKLMGPQTIEAINSLDPVLFNNSIFKMRVKHYLKNADNAVLPALIERSLSFVVG
jgi:lysozyme family protein